MTTSRPIDGIIGTDWREQYVDANGVRQHVWRTGGGGPVLVALPGFQEIGLTWARVAKRLERAFHVIMVDFRAQGRTERGTATYSQTLLVEDITALLGELGIAQASVIGFSNGAGVAAELAATCPALVACAVLEDPPRNTGRTTAMGESPQYQAWHARWLEWLERYQAADANEQIAMIGSQIPAGASTWPNDDIIAFAESFAQLDIDFVRDAAALWRVKNRSTEKLLEEIRCPTLVLEATKGVFGSASPPLSSEVVALPHVTRVAFDTSHFVRREEFERYMAVVEPFLVAHASAGA